MENNFLDDAPPGFEPTMELKWIKCDTPSEPTPAVLSYKYNPVYDSHNFDAPIYVLCQKWQGAFRDVWVRVPIETP